MKFTIIQGAIIFMGKNIPRERGLDNTITVLKEAYEYVPNRLEKHDTNIFELRALGGRRTVVISGKEAAELFYNNDLIERQGTLPKRIVNTLFGKGAIHTTGGKKHIDSSGSPDGSACGQCGFPVSGSHPIPCAKGQLLSGHLPLREPMPDAV